MVELYNTTGTIGQIITYMTYNVTGDLFTTLLTIVILITILAISLRIPLEFTSILILPLLITIMAYSGQFIQIGGVILIYLALILAKNFFFK